jgi:DNA-directed RNA polymerase subunit beta
VPRDLSVDRARSRAGVLAARHATDGRRAKKLASAAERMSMQSRVYGRVTEIVPVPNLKDLQVKSYRRFLQLDRPAHKRENVGLEAILREIFPVESFDKAVALEYLGYELGRPRYSAEECRRLRLTFGMPFKIRVRLRKAGEEAIEEDVYLGEMPKMIGGGEFIVNGVERVIVNQLHRSPGVDFSEDLVAGELRLHKCRVIPERGSWIEVEVTRKQTLRIRIDQSGKFPATALLRCFADRYSTDADLIRIFYPTETIDLESPKSLDKIAQKVAVSTIVDPGSGEPLVEGGERIATEMAKVIRDAGVKSVDVVSDVKDPLLLETLKEDVSKSREDALMKLYARLRPGYPPDKKKAEDLFADRFLNVQKYSLGKVGRFRMNRKFGLPDRAGMDSPDEGLLLTAEDLVRCIQYVSLLREGKGEIDDIDHLGNRRVRTIDELAADEFRRGFLRMKRAAQERMGLMDEKADLTPRSLLHYKPVSSAVEGFFGRGELSQIVDQTNPLAQLTHERRLSALGPGGLNRKRAGFEVRDVHISHYGRICPIETPEGANIGLISSLSIYAKVDEFGFLITPYRVFKKGRFTGEVVDLRADQEEGRVIAPADTPVDPETGKILGDTVLARLGGDFVYVKPESIEFMDVSPKQLVSLSAALIPFLEHDDANRALMGSNMQRQAVPLMVCDPPVVATGMEKATAQNSGMVVIAEEAGTVRKSTADEVVVDDRAYRLKKFQGLTEKTCLNQRPCVRVGDHVEKGQVIADGAATRNGELALGKNVLVAFMTYDGYNFEDAILVSEKLVRDDIFTSVHIEEFEIEVRETELGKEEITPDVPNVSRRALANLDERGIVRVGTKVGPGDVLVGKVAPKSKTELTPEEKLLRAIFGRMGEEVKNESLEVPPGVEGVVIDAASFSRKTHLTEEERERVEREVEQTNEKFGKLILEQAEAMVAALESFVGGPVLVESGAIRLHADDIARMEAREVRALLGPGRVGIKDERKEARFLEIVEQFAARLEDVEIQRARKVERLTKGDQLPAGVLELIKVFVATKRKLKVGDKMAGRHGNKGVVARILAEEDMPHLADGTQVDILLNPLGVPSRMNVGQILETHLGWAAQALGLQVVTPVFDGTSEEEIRELLVKAGLPRSGKVTLYDGRTGEPFDQDVTVGFLYMLKLHHMVDDKIHARATGPYSLITQQPLGGKARFGGQRFGEMEVWALEAYGAANILQELLTVKSDDVDGRAKIYESMVKGENVLEPGTPISFDVLTNEIKGLCLNMELEKAKADGGREFKVKVSQDA